MNDSRFDELEQLNAQIDVWIDQEEFDFVLNAFDISPLEDDAFKKAFSDGHCTHHFDAAWNILLDANSTPHLKKFLFQKKWIPFSPSNHEIDGAELEELWAKFFWAKLIRAKIQQKGSDCYFRRLDQVIVFLERNQPIVKRSSGIKNIITIQTNKLAIIYFLEMAACGEGPDQRSFAARARRLLKEHFGDSENEEKRLFYNFYDLVARYSIGLGFQHDGQGRKAVSEYNFIIKELRELFPNDGEPNRKPSDLNWENYANKRLFLDFLYLPAVLGRASIENKLQLAYHALETITDYWKNPKHPYLIAKKCCLLSEANRLMGNHKPSESNLIEVAELLIKKCQINSPEGKISTDLMDLFEQINNKVHRQKWANIYDRLLDTYIALHLDKLKEELEERTDLSKSLEKISKIFSMYWEASKWQATNRTGYFELAAAYLGWIAKRKDIDPNNTVMARSIAVELYKKNREYFPIHKKPDSEDRDITKRQTCSTCTQLGIKLERLGPSHYQEFVKNMSDFYNNNKFETGEDLTYFRDKIFKTEREHREDSAYQKREMALAQLGDGDFVPSDWCEKCLGEKTNPGRTRISFSGLLNCADSHGGTFSLQSVFSRLLNSVNSNQNNNANHSKQGEALSLDKKHYEHLMDHWDSRFLKHLEIESVHFPRCKALHLLGLQRWNSTSPAIGRSLGGGYLLYHTNKNGQVDLGIAVDPGFDFVRNLFHLGFSLSDIDVVLLSHAHLDHIRDFESLVTLCLELNKRHPDKVKRRLHTIMTLGVYRRLSHIFDSTGLREFVEPYILDIEKEIRPNFIEPYIDGLEYYKPFLKPNANNQAPEVDSNNHKFIFQEKLPRREEDTDRGRFRFLSKSPSEPTNEEGLRISITATRAYHNDFSESSDSFGFKIKISDAAKKSDTCTIGYTGDTSWSPDIIDQYKNCDALLVHLGSLINRGKDIRFDDYTKDGQKCWNLIKEKNHPYLFGLLRFLTQIAGDKSTENGKVPLVLLSEFGEELRGRIRLDLYNRLSDHYSGKNGLRKITLLPLDVGLDVILALDGSTTNEPKEESLKPHKGERDCDRLRALLKEDSLFLINCVICEEFILPSQVDFETYGHDEGLYCVCKACRRSTPQNFLQEKLRDLYEVARPLASRY